MICIFGLDENMSFEELGAVELLQSLRVKVNTVLPPSAQVSNNTHRVLSKMGVRIQPTTEQTFSSIKVLFVFGREECFTLMRERNLRAEHVVYFSQSVEPTQAEIRALQDGLIDEVSLKGDYYAGDYIRKLTVAAGRGVEYRSGYTPFCNPLSSNSGLSFRDRRCGKEFNVLQVVEQGDLTRPDDYKKMLCGVTTPWNLEAHFYILAYEGHSISSPVSSLFLHISDKTPNAFEGPLVYGAAHALMQYPSRDEGFSFEVAKAILTGLAVVCPAYSGNLGAIRHGETGFLASTYDEAAYYTSRFAWEPKLRATMAMKAYKEFITGGPGDADFCGKWWKEFV